MIDAVLARSDADPGFAAQVDAAVRTAAAGQGPGGAAARLTLRRRPARAAAAALRTAWPCAVVVEVDEHVAAATGPLPHPVGPPAQVGVAVRAGVEVPGVGAVHPDVDERRGRPQHARQLRAAHHAVGRTVPLEQREHAVVVPAGVPELHGHPHPRRQPAEEPVQPGVVALVAGVQLHEQDRPPVPQLVPGRRQPRQPGLGRVQPLGVGQPARRLHRQPEPVGQPAAPAREASRPAASGRSWRSARRCRTGARSAPAGPAAGCRAGTGRRPSGRSSTPTSRCARPRRGATRRLSAQYQPVDFECHQAPHGEP